MFDVVAFPDGADDERTHPGLKVPLCDQAPVKCLICAQLEVADLRPRIVVVRDQCGTTGCALGIEVAPCSPEAVEGIDPTVHRSSHRVDTFIKNRFSPFICARESEEVDDRQQLPAPELKRRGSQEQKSVETA